MTDKNGPFLKMVFKHGKKWVDTNGAKCNMGFGRITKNTPNDAAHAVVNSWSRGTSRWRTKFGVRVTEQLLQEQNGTWKVSQKMKVETEELESMLGPAVRMLISDESWKKQGTKTRKRDV